MFIKLEKVPISNRYLTLKRFVQQPMFLCQIVTDNKLVTAPLSEHLLKMQF